MLILIPRVGMALSRREPPFWRPLVPCDVRSKTSLANGARLSTRMPDAARKAAATTCHIWNGGFSVSGLTVRGIKGQRLDVPPMELSGINETFCWKLVRLHWGFDPSP